MPAPQEHHSLHRHNQGNSLIFFPCCVTSDTGISTWTSSGSSTPTSTVGTPKTPKEKDAIRSAAIRVYCNLPRDNQRWAQVRAHVTRHALREETTYAAFMEEAKDILTSAQPVEPPPKHDSRDTTDNLGLLSSLHKDILWLRACRKYDLVMDKVKQIKAKYSLRRAAVLLHTPLTTFLRMCSVPKAKAQKVWKVTPAQKEVVTNFVLRDDITMRLPTKREAKNHYVHTAMLPA